MEKDTTKRGMVVLGIAVGVVALILAIFAVVFSTIRIQELEQRMAALETAMPAGPQDYAFTIKYHDGTVPGTNYEISLQRKTRILTVVERRGCSLLPEECEELDLDETNAIMLSEEDYDLVLAAYNAIKDKLPPEEPFYDTTGELFNWEMGILALARSYTGEGSDYETDDPEELEEQDANEDGVISEHEFAVYMLELVAKE